MNCVHGNSPTGPYRKPGSLLWNPVLTQLAQRYLKISIDVHMRVDVELLILVDFNELRAWQLAHWTLPWIWEPALKPEADTTCAKRSWDFSRFPCARRCGTLSLIGYNYWFLHMLAVRGDPPQYDQIGKNFLLTCLSAMYFTWLGEIRAWHQAHRI